MVTDPTEAQVPPLVVSLVLAILPDRRLMNLVKTRPEADPVIEIGLLPA